ncbi:unnamed protein product [Sphagnum balticum]
MRFLENLEQHVLCSPPGCGVGQAPTSVQGFLIFPPPVLQANLSQRQAVVVADSRVVVYDSVATTQSIWIKGKNFSIQNLTLEPELSKVWSDGAVASFRLSPQDYHRYHSPVEGTLVWWKHISGEYYNVDAIALRFHDHFRKEGSYIKKGEEVGMFEFGGSSIIVAFEKGRILFDEDLISVSKRAITVNVEVGMRLGKALTPNV